MNLQLLLDQNLAPRLAKTLAHRFPRIAHISEFALQQASDDAVWRFARAGGWTIVTKDSDYVDLAIINGPPPQVIWIRIGNCSTERLTQILDTACSRIAMFAGQSDKAVIEIT